MKKTIVFWISFFVTIGLFVGGFFVPPTGQIHGSVLTAAGVLAFFATLAQIPVIIEAAEHAKITKGDMTIEINKES